jgi:hypothetical protein
MTLDGSIDVDASWPGGSPTVFPAATAAAHSCTEISRAGTTVPLLAAWCIIYHSMQCNAMQCKQEDNMGIGI